MGGIAVWKNSEFSAGRAAPLPGPTPVRRARFISFRGRVMVELESAAYFRYTWSGSKTFRAISRPSRVRKKQE